MKICHYNSNQAGAVVGDQVYPIGDAMLKAGHLRERYTMLEVVEVLANEPAAMQCVRDALKTSSPVPLSSVTLLAPILNPPSLWAATSSVLSPQIQTTPHP